MIVGSLFEALDIVADDVNEIIYRKIDEDITGGPRTGKFYRNPLTGETYQASSEQEQIQEVTGDAREGLDRQPTSQRMVKEVFIRDDLNKLIHLIYAPEYLGGRNLLLGSLDDELKQRVGRL